MAGCYDEMLQHNYIHLAIKGLSDIDYLKEIFEENKSKTGTLLVIDDQMQNIDQNVVSIFTIYSHHYMHLVYYLHNLCSFPINFTELSV